MRRDTNLKLFEADSKDGPPCASEDAFRKVYYDLYSNSDASRADRIFEDLSKLILLKALAERNGTHELIRSFTEDPSVSSAVLIDELAAHFPSLVGNGELFSIGDSAVRSALLALQEVDTAGTPAATLGDAFQALIGPRIRGDKGQFFTPRTLVAAMVSIANTGPCDKVVDPAAGTGGFLVATHAFRTAKGGCTEYGPLIGIDRDRDMFRFGGAMTELATEGHATFYCANSLDMKRLADIGQPSPFDADVVLTNPPFGARIGVSEPSILEQFDLGQSWIYSESDKRWFKTRSLRQSQDPQVLFIELCLRLLRPGGLLGIVLPEGIFGNRQTGYIWDYIRASGTVEALIDCPRTTFQPGTDTKTNVVFIRKADPSVPTSSVCKTLVAVAKHCGHDRRGRSRTRDGNRVADDFDTMGKVYRLPQNDIWCECEITDPYYVVPRFYHNAVHSAVVRADGEFTGTTLTIGDMVHAKHLTVRKGHEVGAEAYGTGDIPFIRTSDISNWEVSLDPTNGVSEEIYEKYRRPQNLRPGDILLVVDGRYKIGRTAILQEHSCRSVVQSHLRIITVNKTSPVTAYELLYILNKPSVLEQMRNLTFIQSTLGSLGKRLHNLEIPIPRRSPEWMAKVAEFERGLKERAALLQTLRQWENPEPEL